MSKHRYTETMDPECVRLCDAMNELPGIRTIESCCGHGKEPFRIWFLPSSLQVLPLLLYFIDACHVGFNWDCFVTTDCGMSPANFRLESRSLGEAAYQEANVIADALLEELRTGREKAEAETG